MQRAQWSRPSCIVMLALFALLLAAILWLASGYFVRTPNPAAVPKESPTYDTSVPSGARPGSDR